MSGLSPSWTATDDAGRVLPAAQSSERGRPIGYNLAGSGGLPLTLRELLEAGDCPGLLFDHDLGYLTGPGTARLRQLLADQYCAHPEETIVTAGATEANAVALAAVVGRGSHVVVMDPGCRKAWRHARSLGAAVAPLPMRGRSGWRPDIAALQSAMRPDTAAIVLANPNSPLGTVLTGPEIDAVVRTAARVGAWIIADEAHRGTELVGAVGPSFWGRYDRVMCVGSLSHTFAMPGLRVGWLVAPRKMLSVIQQRHDHAAAGTSCLSVRLAEVALSSPAREWLLVRSRRLIRARRSGLRDWVAASGGLLHLVASQATALGLVRYHLGLPSQEVADAILVHGGVLVAPGARFGVEGHLRVGLGVRDDYLAAGLDRISGVLSRLHDAD